MEILSLYLRDHSQDVIAPIKTTDSMLGQFSLGDGGGRWASDGIAFLVPKLKVTGKVIRALVNGAPLFYQLNDMVMMRESPPPLAIIGNHSWSYVWGDIEVFNTGEPEITSCVLVPGPVQWPHGTQLMPYIAELKKLRSTAV